MATVLAASGTEAHAGGFVGTPAIGSGFSISRDATADTITVNNPTAVINWTPTDAQSGGGPIDFLPSGNTAIFQNATGNQGGFTVLNRIVPADAGRGIALNGHVVTQLRDASGTVTSNGGKVWFYSPGGILIGGGAVFDVGGLLLTTGDPSTAGGTAINPGGPIAMSTTAPTSGIVVSSGAIINALATEQSSGGSKSAAYVAMVSPVVRQSGTVNVNGAAGYVAAEAATLTINDGLFDISVSSGSDTAVEHGGATLWEQANSDSINRRAFLVSVPKNDAITMALTSGSKLGFDPATGAHVAANGAVVLSAGYNIDNGAIGAKASSSADAGLDLGGNVKAHFVDASATGTVKLTGKIDVSGTDTGARGGGAGLFGAKVAIEGSGSIDATGNAGGGTIAIGAGLRGMLASGRAAPSEISFGRDASLDASALTSGNGGIITLWSDVANPLGLTRALGTIRADGGAQGGNGGFIETSGARLDVAGVRGSAAAPFGEAGEWLFDPYDIEVVSTLSTSTASQMLASDIVNLLNGGTSVTLDTGGTPPNGVSNSAQGNITVGAPIIKTTGGAATLTLRATKDITVQSGADIGSTSGAFSIVLTADTNNDGMGIIKLGANLTSLGSQQNGLRGIKYEGYFNDNFSFFNSASVQADSRFNNLFTSINTTTPGQNFDETYSVRFFGFFQATTSGTYQFRTTSDDASYLFLGSPGESVASLEARAGQATVVSNGGLHGTVSRSGSINLNAGSLYPILVYFGENGGGDNITVDFAVPSGSFQNNGTGFYFPALAGR